MAATAPPPPACSQSSVECAISPAPGTRSTRANRIHSTCPTTATRMEQCRTSGTRPKPRPAEISHRAGRGVSLDDGCRGDDPAVRDVLCRARRRGARPPAQAARPRSGRRRIPGDVPPRAPRLRPPEHGEHLRAWVLTIAARVAIDTHRRAGEPTDELPELAHLDGRPAHEELAFLTDALPAKERRRSCSATATTSTTRRSPPRSTRARTPRDRRRPRACDGCEGGSHDRSHRPRPPLPRRRRPLRVARRGVRRLREPARRAPRRDDRPRAPARLVRRRVRPHATLEEIARLAGRAGPARRGSAIDGARRELDEYFDGSRHVVRPPGRSPRAGAVQRRVLGELAQVPYGQHGDLRGAREPRREPEGGARGRDGDEPQPDPDRPPLPPDRRRLGQPRRLRRRASSARSSCYASRERCCRREQVSGFSRTPRSYSSRRYPTPHWLTTTSTAPAASSLRRRRDAWESTVRVRIPLVRMPHTSRRSSVFVKTRAGRSRASQRARTHGRRARPRRRRRAPAARGGRRRAAPPRRRPPGRSVAPEQRPHPREQLEVDVARDDVVRPALECPHPDDRIRIRRR